MAIEAAALCGQQLPGSSGQSCGEFSLSTGAWNGKSGELGIAIMSMHAVFRTAYL